MERRFPIPKHARIIVVLFAGVAAARGWRVELTTAASRSTYQPVFQHSRGQYRFASIAVGTWRSRLKSRGPAASASGHASSSVMNHILDCYISVQYWAAVMIFRHTAHRTARPEGLVLQHRSFFRSYALLPPATSHLIPPSPILVTTPVRQSSNIDHRPWNHQGSRHARHNPLILSPRFSQTHAY